MALPKRRHSHARTHKRRSHDALKATGVSVCSDCGEPKEPHRLCASCGKYKGRTVFTLDAEVE